MLRVYKFDQHTMQVQPIYASTDMDILLVSHETLVNILKAKGQPLMELYEQLKGMTSGEVYLAEYIKDDMCLEVDEFMGYENIPRKVPVQRYNKIAVLKE